MPKARVLASLFLVLAAAGEVEAQTMNAPVDSHNDRDTFLIAGATIDVLAAGWATYGFVAGERPLLGSGLTIVATAPVAAYGATILNDNSSDKAAWIVTVAAGLLFTKACVDIVRSNHETPPERRPKENGPHISIVPSAVETPDGLHPAFAVAGAF